MKNKKICAVLDEDVTFRCKVALAGGLHHSATVTSAILMAQSTGILQALLRDLHRGAAGNCSLSVASHNLFEALENSTLSSAQRHMLLNNVRASLVNKTYVPADATSAPRRLRDAW